MLAQFLGWERRDGQTDKLIFLAKYNLDKYLSTSDVSEPRLGSVWLGSVWLVSGSSFWLKSSARLAPFFKKLA